MSERTDRIEALGLRLAQLLMREGILPDDETADALLACASTLMIDFVDEDDFVARAHAWWVLTKNANCTHEEVRGRGRKSTLNIEATSNELAAMLRLDMPPDGGLIFIGLVYKAGEPKTLAALHSSALISTIDKAETVHVLRKMLAKYESALHADLHDLPAELPVGATPLVDKRYCSVCGTLQFNSSSGLSCQNGHGGAESWPTSKGGEP